MPTVIEFFAFIGLGSVVTLVAVLGYEAICRTNKAIKQHKELKERFRAECVCRDCYNFDETQGECRLLILNRPEKIKRGLIYNPNVFFCKFGKKKRSE